MYRFGGPSTSIVRTASCRRNNSNHLYAPRVCCRYRCCSISISVLWSSRVSGISSGRTARPVVISYMSISVPPTAYRRTFRNPRRRTICRVLHHHGSHNHGHTAERFRRGNYALLVFAVRVHTPLGHGVRDALDGIVNPMSPVSRPSTTTRHGTVMTGPFARWSGGPSPQPTKSITLPKSLPSPISSTSSPPPILYFMALSWAKTQLANPKC